MAARPEGASPPPPSPAGEPCAEAHPILRRMRRPGPKRILSCDGGGIRGLISVAILSQLEAELRRELRRPDLVLADYFDLIAGTSTGGIIATCLSTGMAMAQVRDLYLDHGRAMFQPARGWGRLTRARYRAEALASTLRASFNQQLGDVSPSVQEREEPVRLGDPRLRGLLMLVLRNHSTDSPWPLCNNPLSLYNQPDHPDCNLRLPLWQLVRASTAAPTFFPPEEIRLSGPEEPEHRFVFVDGGITCFNHPAWLAVQMATTAPYQINWRTGVDQLLIVSVGTGSAPAARLDLRADQLTLLDHLHSVPLALLHGASDGWDMVCRVLGECRFGLALDREFGAMVQAAGTAAEGSNWTGVKQFAYVRYDPLTSRGGLDALGLTDLEARPLAAMDDVRQIPSLLRVGEAFAERHLSLDHLRGFLEPPAGDWPLAA